MKIQPFLTQARKNIKLCLNTDAFELYTKLLPNDKKQNILSHQIMSFLLFYRENFTQSLLTMKQTKIILYTNFLTLEKPTKIAKFKKH